MVNHETTLHSYSRNVLRNVQRAAGSQQRTVGLIRCVQITARDIIFNSSLRGVEVIP